MPQIFPKTPKKKKMEFFFKKTKKHSIKSALKTRRNKVLKEKIRFLPNLIFLV